jgi:glutathione peroxidase
MKHVLRSLIVGLSLVASVASSQTQTPAVLNHTMNPLLPGKPIALSQYAGQVVLIVNVASECGFTPQYEGLEALYKRYQSKGFVVLGVPANDFGGQEKGSNKQIAEFCKANFGVTFPMFEKIVVPIAQHPLFASLIKATNQPPKWNFHKYLVDRGGKVRAFSSSVEPLSAALTNAIEKALASK